MFSSSEANGRLVPLVGDIGLAVWKANWRNANLLEEFLAQRGQENLRFAAQGAISVDAAVVHDALKNDADGILGNVDQVPAHPAAGRKKKRSWNPFASHEDAEADAAAAQQAHMAAPAGPARPIGAAPGL